MSFLRSLPDKQILSKITELVRRERSLTRGVLLHLIEIERRRLHLKLGYASMFDYCTTGLGYSSSAAARRIRTARCIARYPEVLALLKSNEVNLSTVSQVSRVLTPDNKATLLQRICGKSQREVGAIIAEYEPRPMPPDRVRPIVVQVPANALATGSSTEVVAAAAELPVVSKCAESKYADSNDLQSAHCRSGSELPQPSTEKRMHLSFSASEAFMAKLEKIRSLAWHKLPANASLEQVFDLAMDCFIQKEDPRERQTRREHLRNRKETTAKKASTRSRHIAATVKDDVFVRDQSRCSHVGAAGKRCEATRALQIDHIEPFSRGGANSACNLRVLCAYHNRLEAERVLGRGGG